MHSDSEALSLFIPSINCFEENMNDAINYIHDVKTRFGRHPGKFCSFSTALKDIMAARICYNGDVVTLKEVPEGSSGRIRDILQGHDDLIARFDTYLPSKNSHDANETERVSPDESIKCLNLFPDHNDSGKLIPAREVEGKKRKKMFEDFSLSDSDTDKAKKKIRTEGLSFLGKARERLDSATYINLLRSLYCYGEGRMEKYEIENIVEKMGKQGNCLDLVQDFKHYLKQCENIATKPRMQKPKERETCERITPSYRADSEISPPSRMPERSELEKSVLILLNDSYKCVPPEPTYSRKRGHQQDMREEIMSKIEDDGHQIDLLIEWFKAAIKYAEALLKGKQVHDVTKMFAHERRKKQFFQCVERIYRKQGLMVKTLYEENPKTALPIILRRLKEKEQKIQDFRKELEEIWKEAYRTHFPQTRENHS